jgi:hypothetical protein
MNRSGSTRKLHLGYEYYYRRSTGVPSVCRAPESPDQQVEATPHHGHARQSVNVRISALSSTEALKLTSIQCVCCNRNPNALREYCN